MAVTVQFIADVVNWLAGLSKSEQAIEDNADGLEDLMRKSVELGREAGKTSDEIAADFSKAFGVPLDRAKKAVDEVAASTDELGDGAGDAGQAVGDGIGKGAETAAGALTEMGSIARDVLNGDITSSAEAATGALGALGPAGVVAGAVLATGIGIASSALQQAQERLQEARDAARELASTLYQNNGKLPLEDQISRAFDVLVTERRPQGALEGIVDQWVDFGTVLDNVKFAARAAGTPVDDLVEALGGGDVKQAQKQLELINEAIAELEDRLNAGEVRNFDFGVQASQLVSVRDELEKVVTTSELAGDALSVVRSALPRPEDTEAIRAVGEAWQDNAVDAADYWTTTKEGAKSFDWKTYLTDAEAALQAANQYKQKIVTLPPEIAGEASRVFADEGAEAANAYMDAFAAASAADRARFTAVATANGEAAGIAAGESLAANAEAAARAKAQGWGQLFPPQAVKVAVDDSAVKSWHPPMLPTMKVRVQPQWVGDAFSKLKQDLP